MTYPSQPVNGDIVSSMKLLFVACLVASSSWAASPPPSAKRMSILLVPMDTGAEAKALDFETSMNKSLGEFQGIQLKTTDDLFGVPPDDDAEASMKRAEQGFKETKDAFEARNYDDAEKKARATIKEFGKAAASMKGCGHLCDAVAMYAASLQARGDVEEAKIQLLDLLSLAPTFEIDRKKYPQEFISLRVQVATGRSAQLRGNLNIVTKPQGARIYLDGEFMGYSPKKLETLVVGKHVLRVERPGFKKWGSVVDVSPEDLDIKPELQATAAYKAYDTQLDRLATEALKDKGGTTMSAISKTLGVDRALVGVLKEINETGGSELHVGYFDMHSGKRLAYKKITFQGNEYGQIDSELGRVVNYLLTNPDGAEKVTKGGDPLDSKHGMEDWNSEDKGGNRTAKDKNKKKGDPLDHRDGMEDW